MQSSTAVPAMLGSHSTTLWHLATQRDSVSGLSDDVPWSCLSSPLDRGELGGVFLPAGSLILGYRSIQVDKEQSGGETKKTELVGRKQECVLVGTMQYVHQFK